MKKLWYWIWSLVIKNEKFIKFCLVGVMNAVLSILIFNALIYCGVHYVLANSIAFVLTVINSFYWNRNHVFKQGNKTSRIKFLALYLFTFLFGNALLVLFIRYLGMHPSIAQIIMMAINTFINYTLNRLWVFKLKEVKFETSKD